MGFFDLFRRPGADRDKVAIEIDVATGVLERCLFCKHLRNRNRDDRLPAADLEAHQRFDRNDPSIALFSGDREDLLQRLRAVRRPIPFRCPCDDD
jgi:beta-galactosidase/beta-glucuronidase